MSAGLANDILPWEADEYSDGDGLGGDTRDRSALEAFCDTFLDTSVLVPLAKK